MIQSQKDDQSRAGVLQLISGLLLIPIGIFISLRASEDQETTLTIIGVLVVVSGAINAVYAYRRRIREAS